MDEQIFKYSEGIDEEVGCYITYGKSKKYFNPSKNRGQMTTCPVCKSSLIERKNSFSNSFFLGCSSYPECTFTCSTEKDYTFSNKGASNNE